MFVELLVCLWVRVLVCPFVLLACLIACVCVHVPVHAFCLFDSLLIPVSVCVLVWLRFCVSSCV